jgi:hypothetical protein
MGRETGLVEKLIHADIKYCDFDGSHSSFATEQDKSSYLKLREI